ncbi:MAG: hypothetical protein K5929_03280 [Lachnospiraceae bacterium]|nr:hypothetical protein [Lachnospiraceae bacterium]
MTVEEFVTGLVEIYNRACTHSDLPENAGNILDRMDAPNGKRYQDVSPDPMEKARELGLTDRYQEEHKEAAVSRRDAAKIVHIFLRDVLKVPDLADISQAAKLKDLYDCRVCVNDIAQVFLRGIMQGHEYPGGLLLFESYEMLTDEETEKVFSAVRDIVCHTGHA